MENLEQSEVVEKKDNPDLCTKSPDPLTEETELQKPKIFGTFAAVEDLIKAYTDLQADYTKKSQELARVTGKCKSTDNETLRVTGRCKGTDNVTLEVKNNNAGAAKINEVVQASPQVPTAEDIIKDYLLSVAAGKAAPAVIAGSGTGFAFSNTVEAKTINATTKVVENFLKNKGKL